MKKKSLIIAAIATLGISVCMGTAETSFAAENNAITLESEDAFGDGSENTEEFSAGEGQEENAAAFQYILSFLFFHYANSLRSCL